MYNTQNPAAQREHTEYFVAEGRVAEQGGYELLLRLAASMLSTLDQSS
jgi:hypothetical protein